MSKEEENSPDNIDELMEEEDTVDANIFQVHDQLSLPSAKSYPTAELHTLVHQGIIDLNPPYQRDVVWPESKQMGLIDSIFRNFYIPPVVLAVQIDDDGLETRVCVDGKQRLTSVQKFFDGQIPYRDFKTKKTFWYTRSATEKSTRLEIPDNWKKIFSEKVITVVEYHGLAPGAERDIFQRVQLGMSLTAAEKLQAIASPWAEWISDLNDSHVTSEQGLANILTWDTKRGRDFQCVAQFVYCSNGLPEPLLPTAQKLEKWLTRVDTPPPTFKTQIRETLSTFWHIASTPGLSAAFVQVEKRVAPVEFVFIAVLLFIMRGYSHEDQAKAILHLRLCIREQFKDVRNNTIVGKALWEYITMVTGRGGIGQLDGTSMAGPSGAKKGRKRRLDDDEYDVDNDEDYRPSPVKSIGRPVKTRTKAAKKSS